MIPTEILSAEHQNILKAIDLMFKECTEIGSGKELNKVLMKTCDHVWESYREPYMYGERYDHCTKCDLYR